MKNKHFRREKLPVVLNIFEDIGPFFGQKRMTKKKSKFEKKSQRINPKSVFAVGHDLEAVLFERHTLTTYGLEVQVYVVS